MNENIISLEEVLTSLQGNNLVTSVSALSENGEINGYEVFFQNGKSYKLYFGSDGKDGSNGIDGNNGKDCIDGVDGTDGKDGADGKTPVKGTDYHTEADKGEMVNRVLAALPAWEGGSY